LPIVTSDMMTAVAPIVTLSPIRMAASDKRLPSMACENKTASCPMMQLAPI
jgi:hypothetical protein